MITLTSDFSNKDPYVAEMKGVILGVNPNAIMVDVTHEIEKFNIRMGAFTLASAAPYFPKGTVHLAVVDPGVGTQRRPIIIQTKKALFVGPDNGLLILAAESQIIEHIYQLTNSKFMSPHVSGTFHGRDIFAPVAAYLDKGVKPEEFGPEIQGVVKPDFSQVTQQGNALHGEVLHVDSFGNIITNFKEEKISQIGVETVVNLTLADHKLKLKFCKAYADATLHEPVALIGSHGFLEIALNQGSAAERFGVKPADKIVIMRES